MDEPESQHEGHDWRIREFRNALLALAAEGDVALSVYPKGVVRPDELALDFDHWFTAVRGENGLWFNAKQSQMLSNIDTALSRMSGRDNARLWTEDAVRNSPEWGHVREMARQALALLDWPLDPPVPMNERSYQRGGD